MRKFTPIKGVSGKAKIFSYVRIIIIFMANFAFWDWNFAQILSFDGFFIPFISIFGRFCSGKALFKAIFGNLPLFSCLFRMFSSCGAGNGGRAGENLGYIWDYLEIRTNFVDFLGLHINFDIILCFSHYILGFYISIGADRAFSGGWCCFCLIRGFLGAAFSRFLLRKAHFTLCIPSVFRQIGMLPGCLGWFLRDPLRPDRRNEFSEKYQRFLRLKIGVFS